MLTLIFVTFFTGHFCVDFNNNRAVLISKYAKVSHWSPSATVNSTRQNGNGQALWTHRSDATIQSRPVPNRQRVIAHYPDYNKVQIMPAVGEVIQDRSNYKPHFDYGKLQNQDDLSSYQPSKPISMTNHVRHSLPSSANTFPAVFNIAPGDTMKKDSYSSPYTSYNPPNHRQEDGAYPPLDSYAAPSAADHKNAPYPDKPDKEPSNDSTLGPPIAPNFDDDSDSDEGPMITKEVDAPPSDHTSHGSHGPPNYPPRNEMDIYYPPDDNSPPADQDPNDHGMPDMIDSSDNQMPMQPIMMMDQTKDMMMDEGKDMATPADSHSFPNYLYENPHYDDHVYEEIPHTTTEATEDKRVSSTHYSYYYLGRKLWYIPLYFSIYFMVYVTILILKAIARHKVELKNEWATSHTRSARMMTFDNQMKSVDEVHKNVTEALDRVSRSYSNIAM